MARPNTFLVNYHDEKCHSMFYWNSYAGSSLHKLATCAGWHQDYWKMSQVSEAFYCHCCQVDFSMTSQKCNGKTLPWKNGKNCSRPFSDGWLVGWKSLHCFKKSLICSKYGSYKFQPCLEMKCSRCRQRLCTNKGKSETMFFISAARAWCHKSVILRACFQHICELVESLTA